VSKSGPSRLPRYTLYKEDLEIYKLEIDYYKVEDYKYIRE
jgi:hypothetical protein